MESVIAQAAPIDARLIIELVMSLKAFEPLYFKINPFSSPPDILFLGKRLATYRWLLSFSEHPWVAVTAYPPVAQIERETFPPQDDALALAFLWLSLSTLRQSLVRFEHIHRHGLSENGASDMQSSPRKRAYVSDAACHSPPAIILMRRLIHLFRYALIRPFNSFIILSWTLTTPVESPVYFASFLEQYIYWRKEWADGDEWGLMEGGSGLPERKWTTETVTHWAT
ncbi:hypothetical protein EVAR_20165_1 [Eumeta japonica]|uniref:Uncharacterized protein n=1 Tax=Eumeta variegata TaxID=151549 RepID=A0A4C1UV21_EUMVA|nr:hypothetical protein EVAR_20165_1 [Eumeta japonica]